MATGAPPPTGRKDLAASTRDTVPAPGTGARPARKPKPKAVPATLIFFVRHGTTPTTGQVLPGRAPGLHLADKGRSEAEAVADRLASLTSPSTTPATTPPAHGTEHPTAHGGEDPTAPGDQHPTAAASTNGAARPRGRATATAGAPGLTIAAVYASPLERARETAAPIGRRLGLKVATERGLIEMDFGEWTGAELKTLRKLPEWNAVQRYPSGFQFPGGEAFSAMRARIAATVAALCPRHPGQAIVAVSHADVIKAAVSDALGTHLDLFQRIVVSPCSVTAISYSPTGPIVLAVNSTGSLGGLHPA